MIYVAIDNSTPAGKKMAELMEEMPFATVYRNFNSATKKAFKEVEEGKVIKAKNVAELLRKFN